MTTTAPPGAPTHAQAKKTSGGYVVLAQESPSIENPRWKVVATIPAAKSANEAIKTHASQGVGTAGTFVAVPARSWQPVTTVPTVVTTVSVKPVKP